MDKHSLARLGDLIFRAYDVFGNDYDALDTDLIEAFTEPEQLEETIYYLKESLKDLTEAIALAENLKNRKLT